MNRRLFPLLAVPAIVASVLVGCAKPSVVGKWQGSVPMPGGQGGSVAATVDYKADGTMTQEASTPLGTVSLSGTYKVDGDKLTTNVTDVKMNGAPLPPMIAARVPKSSMNSSGTYKLDGDTLTLTQAAKSVTLTRVKDEAAK